MQVRMIFPGAAAIVYVAVLACSCNKEDESQQPWDGDTCFCSYYDSKAQQHIRDERYSLRAEEAEAREEGEQVSLRSCDDLAAWLVGGEWTNMSCK